jgi:hypothetical protein
MTNLHRQISDRQDKSGGRGRNTLRLLGFELHVRAMNADRLSELVLAAFPVEPLPKMSLHQAHLLDESIRREISEEEWKAAGAIDASRSWRDLPDEQLIECDAALSHFDEESFVYYLPAYLLFAARNFAVEWSHPASSLVGSVVFSLTQHREVYSLSRYKRLTAPQREAVVSFLELIAGYESGPNAPYANKSLARYWMTDEAAKPLIIVP